MGAGGSGLPSGREIILAKERVSIGRGEGTDIPLFGDARVEKLHAYIIQHAPTAMCWRKPAGPQGTYVNDHKVEGSCPLRSGDLIRIGAGACGFRSGGNREGEGCFRKRSSVLPSQRLEGWPGLRYSEAPAKRRDPGCTGASEYLSPGHLITQISYDKAQAHYQIFYFSYILSNC